MQALGVFSRFEQCVLNMALINICNGESDIGSQMRRQYNALRQSTNEIVDTLWLNPHQFTVYLPHPDQEYEDTTLEEGLTKGHNLDVQLLENKSELIYKIPPGGHFVVVLKQRRVNADFAIAATGIFVRALGILTLDAIIDPDQAEYQSLAIKHPIIKDYPQNWETQLRSFLKQETSGRELPQVVRYVDRAFNPDYRPPTWKEVYFAASQFANF